MNRLRRILMISYKKPTYNDADGVKLVAIHHYYTISFWFYVLIYRYVYQYYQCICLGNWRSFSASPSFPVATSMRIFSSVFFFVSLLFLIKLETYRPCGSIQILIVKTHIKITHLIFKNCWIVTWFYVLMLSIGEYFDIMNTRNILALTSWEKYPQIRLQHFQKL